MKINFFALLFILLSLSLANAQRNVPIDNRATAETKSLYSNLLKLSNGHTLFGQQHATEYGHGWSGDENRSDVKSVVGSHPAVIGGFGPNLFATATSKVYS